MSDRTSARTVHGSRHRKHSESNKVLRTITFVLTPFLVFLIVCGLFVIALFKPFTTAKPYLDMIFAPDPIDRENQVSIYHADDAPLRVYDVEVDNKDEGTTEKHKMIYPYYGDYYGSLTISSIGMQETPIYCGIAEHLLAKGVGWTNSSAYIGKVGHVIIAGHNHTYFAMLRYCKEGDIVIIDTDFCKLTYIVKQTVIFHKSELDYMRPTFGQDKLTLYTCWNNGMLGATPYRFGVICDIVEREWKEVNTAG